MKLPKELQNKKKILNKQKQVEFWELKWTFLINQMKHLIAEKGREMVLFNVEAMRDSQKQFEKYMEVCEHVKNRFEVVVSTSLPGEERIFWPYQNVQFYIRDDDEIIHSTGNSKVIQEVFNTSDEPVNTDVPDMEFWKMNFSFHLDNHKYVDESKLFDKDFKFNLPELLKKYKCQQTYEFENIQFWYLLKFFFIASHFHNLDGFGELNGGVPKSLKFKCNCGKTLERRWNLKGILEFLEYNSKHEYYLYISERCPTCGNTMCVYRDRAMEINDYFMPMRLFMNFLDPSWNYNFDHIEMIATWQVIFKIAASTDMDRIQKLFPYDIIKFGLLIQEMEKKFNK